MRMRNSENKVFVSSSCLISDRAISIGQVALPEVEVHSRWVSRDKVPSSDENFRPSKCYTTGASRHWKMGNRDSRDERRTTAEVPVADWLRCTESLWTAPPNCSGALSLASNRVIFHWLRRWLAGRGAPPPTPKEILKLTVYFTKRESIQQSEIRKKLKES